MTNFDVENPDKVSIEKDKEVEEKIRKVKAEIDAEIELMEKKDMNKGKPDNKSLDQKYDLNEDFDFEFLKISHIGDNKESAKQTEPSNESLKPELETDKMELIVQGTKTFNKPLFMKNIRALMTKTGVKIGQIEHEAQVSPGYLSRISKEGSTSDPSLEFVITAADLLDVSVDYLLNGDAEAMTETDNYLVKFFTKILNDTISDRILWDREENEENRVMSYEFPEDVKKLSILYNTKQEDDGVRVYYESSYGSRVHLSRDNDSFSVSIPGTEGKLYVTACIYLGTDEIFYEVYMVIKDSRNPLCSTYSACREIKDIVEKIYEEIIKSSGRVHFSEPVLGVMQSYLGK